MKKIISILMMCFAFAFAANALDLTTVNYYVDTTGVDTNDGLTELTPVPLVNAIALAVAEGSATTYIINVGKGQILFNNLNAISFARDEDITLKIVGSSADSTYYQMKTDAEFATIITSSANTYMGRVFNNPKNTGAGSLTLEVEDFTFRNFGYTNTTAGAFIQITTNGVVNFTMRRCVVERACARSGALVEAAAAGDFSFTMEDCYFNEIYTCNNNLFQAPFVVKNQHSFTATNCVFSNFRKINPKNATSYLGTGNKHGSVMSFLPTVAGASLTLVNNTFVADSAVVDAILGDQATLYLSSTIADVPVTIANNIFIGGGVTSPVAAFYDINVTGTTPVFNDCTNNVMNSYIGFQDVGNDSSSLYTYASEAIDFVMDGDLPELFTTPTGVSYVKAEGSKVYRTGLSSVAPEFDIAGNTRFSTPCVGAYEADLTVVAIPSEQASSAVTLYPNPATDVLSINGNVAKVEIYTISGSLVASSPLVEGSIDIANLVQGVYFVMCFDAQGLAIANQQVMKQ